MARPQAGPEFGYNFDFSLCPLVIWWMNMVQTLTSHVVSAVVLLKLESGGHWFSTFVQRRAETGDNKGGNGDCGSPVRVYNGMRKSNTNKGY